MIDHTACCLTVSVVCFLISLLYLSLTILLYVPQAFAPSAAAVWLILAFFAFRHRASWSGKLLFAAAMLWSATLSIPMILFLEWKPWRACCAVMGMSASLLLLGRFVLWVRKQLRAARERRQKKQSPR
ncbi:MAG: hypothetical protein JW941_07255 [Candidatus Coatesbacteria bacterium]|nr:hypothetical protein [Candidatus Coatesbacteria bacterium]